MDDAPTMTFMEALTNPDAYYILDLQSVQLGEPHALWWADMEGTLVSDLTKAAIFNKGSASIFVTLAEKVRPAAGIPVVDAMERATCRVPTDRIILTNSDGGPDAPAWVRN